MADVIINGMEMPSRCEDCFAYMHNAEYDYAYCNISSTNVLGHGNARLNNCPLRSAPEREHPITSNADRIRAMSDEQLAKLLSALETSGRVFGPDGKAYWLDWLQSPVGGEFE